MSWWYGRDDWPLYVAWYTTACPDEASCFSMRTPLNWGNNLFCCCDGPASGCIGMWICCAVGDFCAGDCTSGVVLNDSMGERKVWYAPLLPPACMTGPVSQSVFIPRSACPPASADGCAAGEGSSWIEGNFCAAGGAGAADSHRKAATAMKGVIAAEPIFRPFSDSGISCKYCFRIFQTARIAGNSQVWMYD